MNRNCRCSVPQNQLPRVFCLGRVIFFTGNFETEAALSILNPSDFLYLARKRNNLCRNHAKQLTKKKKGAIACMIGDKQIGFPNPTVVLIVKIFHTQKKKNS